MRPRELVVAWVEAFNCGNPDEMATFYAERAVNHQVVREPVEGRAAIREMFAKDVASAKMVCIADHISASPTIFLHRRPYFRGWSVGHSRVERSARAARMRFLPRRER